MTPIPTTTRHPIDDRAGRIIAAAFTEFVQRGVRGARMSVIAARAGVSTATLRQYFPSADQLFREVIRSTIVRLIQRPPGVDVPAPLAPGLDGIRDFLRQVLQTLQEPEQAALLRLSLSELTAFPELAILHSTEMIGRVVGRLEELLNEGVRRGQLRLREVRTVARMMVAALITYGLWLTSADTHRELIGPDRQRAEAAAIDLLMSVLRQTAS